MNMDKYANGGMTLHEVQLPASSNHVEPLFERLQAGS